MHLHLSTHQACPQGATRCPHCYQGIIWWAPVWVFKQCLQMHAFGYQLSLLDLHAKVEDKQGGHACALCRRVSSKADGMRSTTLCWRLTCLQQRLQALPLSQ